MYTSKPVWCSGDTQSFTATTTFTTIVTPSPAPWGSADANMARRGWTVAVATAWKRWRSVSHGSGQGCNVTHCGECGPYIQYLPGGGGGSLLGYLSFFMLFPPVPNIKKKKQCECRCENAPVITSNTQCLMFCSILGMPSEGLGKMRRSSRCYTRRWMLNFVPSPCRVCRYPRPP